jgi:hypothetical protein
MNEKTSVEWETSEFWGPRKACFHPSGILAYVCSLQSAGSGHRRVWVKPRESMDPRTHTFVSQGHDIKMHL